MARRETWIADVLRIDPEGENICIILESGGEPLPLRLETKTLIKGVGMAMAALKRKRHCAEVVSLPKHG
jgi:hypothetical protein